MSCTYSVVLKVAPLNSLNSGGCDDDHSCKMMVDDQCDVDEKERIDAEQQYDSWDDPWVDETTNESPKDSKDCTDSKASKDSEIPPFAIKLNQLLMPQIQLSSYINNGSKNSAGLAGFNIPLDIILICDQYLGHFCATLEEFENELIFRHEAAIQAESVDVYAIPDLLLVTSSIFDKKIIARFLPQLSREPKQTLSSPLLQEYSKFASVMASVFPKVSWIDRYKTKIDREWAISQSPIVQRTCLEVLKKARAPRALAEALVEIAELLSHRLRCWPNDTILRSDLVAYVVQFMCAEHYINIDMNMSTVVYYI